MIVRKFAFSRHGKLGPHWDLNLLGIRTAWYDHLGPRTYSLGGLNDGWFCPHDPIGQACFSATNAVTSFILKVRNHVSRIQKQNFKNPYDSLLSLKVPHSHFWQIPRIYVEKTGGDTSRNTFFFVLPLDLKTMKNEGFKPPIYGL